MTRRSSSRDVEQLSAYLDGGLSRKEQARLKARLASDPVLRATLQDLQRTRALLRQLSHKRAPRNFSLTARMVGARPPMPRAYPILRLATVIASLLFFSTFASNLLSGAAPAAPAPAAMEMEQMLATEAPMLAAPPPSADKAMAPTLLPPSGMGGGEAEATPTAAPLASMAPTTAPLASMAPPTESPQVPEERALPKALPEPAPSYPFSLLGSLQVALIVIALASGLSAYCLRHTAIRKWQQKTR